ncbi:MAG: acyltransferase [Pseudomonadota bacterium]
MKSSTGEHYVGLDHVRAVAAFLVFSWHFMHVNAGHISPLPGTFDFFAFSLLAEGHTGVSLFLVLSGYLFAKITEGRRIDYGRFLLARVIRLGPLLALVCAVVLMRNWMSGGSAAFWNGVEGVLAGVIRPTLPNGGWSITVEFHFYLMFPLIVLVEKRRPFAALFLLAIGLAVRVGAPLLTDEWSVRDIAYWTIFGRIDQLVIGVLIARHRAFFAGRNLLAVIAVTSLLLIYAGFDRLGGWYSNEAHPGIWAYLLTLEGVLYGVLIAWYDGSFRFRNVGLSGLVAKIGDASYSIYLLHFFVVFEAARFIDGRIVRLDTFYAAALAGVVSFAVMSLIAWTSYRYFECYWMRFRKPYLTPYPAAERGR